MRTTNMCWFCSTETYVGLQYNSIFPKDKIIHDTKKKIMFSVDGNAEAYNEKFFNFKKRYRATRQAFWAKKYGLTNETNMESLSPQKDKILNYIKHNVDSRAIKIKHISFPLAPNANKVGMDYLNTSIQSRIDDGWEVTRSVNGASSTWKILEYNKSSKKLKVNYKRGGSDKGDKWLSLEVIEFKRIAHGSNEPTVDQSKVRIRFIDDNCRNKIFAFNKDSSSQIVIDPWVDAESCPVPIGTILLTGNNDDNSFGVTVTQDICGAKQPPQNSSLTMEQLFNRYMTINYWSYENGTAFFIDIPSINNDGLPVDYTIEELKERDDGNGGTEEYSVFSDRYYKIDKRFFDDFVIKTKTKMSPVVRTIKNGRSLVYKESDHKKDPCESYEEEGGECPNDCVRQTKCSSRRKDDAGRCPCVKNKGMIKFFKRLTIDIEDMNLQILGQGKYHKDEDDGDEGDGELKLNSAHILTAFPVMDPYKIEPGVYKSTVAQDLPHFILKHSDVKSNGVDYVVKAETIKRWLLMKRSIRMQYADALKKALSLYSSGTFKIKTSGLETTYDISIKSEIKSGRVLYEADMKPIPIGKSLIVSKAKDVDVEILTQISETEYESFIAVNPIQHLKLKDGIFEMRTGGRWGTNQKAMGDPTCNKPIRLIAPSDLMDSLTFSGYAVAKEHGTTLLLYTQKIVETSFLMLIVGIIATIVLCATGVGCSIGALILNVVITVASYMVKEYIKKKTIAMAKEKAKADAELNATQRIEKELSSKPDMSEMPRENDSVYYNFIATHSPPIMLETQTAPLDVTYVVNEKMTVIDHTHVVPG